MPFGQYRGRRLDELPDAYLDWLRSLDDLRQPLRGRVAAEWCRRGGDRARESQARPDPADGWAPTDGPVDGAVAALLIEAGRRALAARFHPDREGGDLATMQVVNATADRLLARFPRRVVAA